MNKQQLEQAQTNIKDLLTFERKTDKLKNFITELEESQYVCISSVNHYELWENKESEMYELFGAELVGILKKKLKEREEYLEKLDANDLISH